MTARYGLFLSPACRDNSDENCSDLCGLEWADELPSLHADPAEDWVPRCKCCGREAELISALERV